MAETAAERISADGASARVVFAAPKGETLTQGTRRADVEATVAQLKNLPQVASVTDPFTSGDINEAGDCRLRTGRIRGPGRRAHRRGAGGPHGGR